jgi:dipeptidyl aminopeptidase/acylaminoacyl peptidase
MDGREMWLMGSDGEDPRRILNATGDEYLGWVAWSPRGHRLAYERSRGEPGNHETEIETCDLNGGSGTVVLSEPTLTGPDGPSPLAWLPDGQVMYTAHTSPSATTYDIWAVTVDPDTGKRRGDPSALTNWERSMPEFFSASADGKRVIYDSHRDEDVLFLGDLRTPDKKLQSRRLTADEWTSYPGDWARDSGAVFFESDRGGRRVIAKVSPESGASEILLSGAASYYDPVLSPDGTRLLFSEKNDQPDPVRRLMSMPIGGGARLSILDGRHTYRCGHSASAGCVLGDVEGKELVFSVLDPVKGKGNEIQRVGSDPYATWSLSPDGTKIAIAPVSRDNWIQVLSIPDHKVTELPHSGTWEIVQHVTWAADGKHLLATAWADPTGKFQSILYVDLQGNLQPLNEVKQGTGWLMDMQASPDGHYLAYTERLYEANITMLENF